MPYLLSLFPQFLHLHTNIRLGCKVFAKHTFVLLFSTLRFVQSSTILPKDLKIVRYCSNRTNLADICTILLKFVKIYIFSKFAQLCSNLYIFCSKLYNFDKICTSLLKFVQLCSNLYKFCSKLHKFDKICSVFLQLRIIGLSLVSNFYNATEI